MKTTIYCQIGPTAPEWIRILPMGEVILGDGREPFRVSTASIERIMEAWRWRGNDMVVDYEHQTISGREAPAAGWVKALTSVFDGLWARVEWTDRAREYIEKKEYRYFSPVVQLNESREVEDLLHVALTNFPAITNLAPLVLSVEPAGKKGITNKREENTGNVEEKGKETDGAGNGNDTGAERKEMIAEKLKVILGLREDASEDQIVALVDDYIKISGGKSTPLVPEIAAALGMAEGDSCSKALQRIESLQAEVKNAARMREELNAMKLQEALSRAERLIQEALSSRRTTPAELQQANGSLRRLAHDDPDFFQELIMSRPENSAIPGPLEPGGRYWTTLTQEDREVCQNLGIRPEDFLKNKEKFKEGR